MLSGGAPNKFVSEENGKYINANLQDWWRWRLVVRDRLWTASRRHCHNLQDSDLCVFCDQQSEIVHHLLLGCLQPGTLARSATAVRLPAIGASRSRYPTRLVVSL